MTSNISHSLAVRKTDGDIHQRRQTSATHSLYGRRTHSSKPFDLINAIANFTSAKRQEVHNIDCGQTAKSKKWANKDILKCVTNDKTSTLMLKCGNSDQRLHCTYRRIGNLIEFGKLQLFCCVPKFMHIRKRTQYLVEMIVHDAISCRFFFCASHHKIKSLKDYIQQLNHHKNQCREIFDRILCARFINTTTLFCFVITVPVTSHT